MSIQKNLKNQDRRKVMQKYSCLLRWLCDTKHYLRSTNFRGYIFPRILRFLAVFAKISTRKILLQLKYAKTNTREKSLSGKEDKKDITFEIPRIYFQNLIHYNCIISFVFLSKHVLNLSWPNFRLLFIFCAWRSLTRRTLVDCHEIVLTDDG